MAGFPHKYAHQWDNKYQTAKGLLYGDKASDYLATCIKKHQLPIGKAFLPGDGEGRHARFLARLGYDVVACDISHVAVTKAKAEDKREQLILGRVVADAKRPPFAPNSMDLVAVMYVHVPPDERRIILRAAAHLLKNNGHLVLEGFHPDQVTLLGKGPGRVELAYDPELICGELAPWRMLEAEVTQTTLNDGPGHQGEAYLTSMIFAKEP